MCNMCACMYFIQQTNVCMNLICTDLVGCKLLHALHSYSMICRNFPIPNFVLILVFLLPCSFARMISLVTHDKQRIYFRCIWVVDFLVVWAENEHCASVCELGWKFDSTKNKSDALRKQRVKPNCAKYERYERERARVRKPSCKQRERKSKFSNTIK